MDNELMKLAERVEQAEGPSRELDVEIALIIDWRWTDWEEGEPTPRSMAEKHGREWFLERVAHTDYCGSWKCIPRFTASIDAAMTLVPEGWAFGISSNLIGACPVAGLQRKNPYAATDAEAATVALALVAAALRARAHDGGDDAPETPQETEQ